MTENANHRYIKEYKIVRDYQVPDYSLDGYEPVGGAVFYDDFGYQAMAYYEDLQRVITKDITGDSDD